MPDQPGHDPADASAQDLPLFDDLRQIGADARNFAQAEIAYQKSRAVLATAAVRDVALLALAGFVFGVFALVGLTVGLLLALTPMIGPWLATLAVVGVLLLATLVCLMRAKRRWQTMTAFLSEGKDSA
ncbi:MAG: phage holin family protein [Novosphingobium sp.]